jgi:hypothetical protein
LFTNDPREPTAPRGRDDLRHRCAKPQPIAVWGAGGGYIEIRLGQDPGAAFAGVADDLHTQYLLAFAPPNRDRNVHEVSVRVTPGGLKTPAKKNYVAPKG